jgi:cell division protein FtsI/penicillin-binding protein 2
MRAILAEVVASGTGRRAKSDLYAIGGKTGTAEVAGPGGYQEGRYVASFCGFAPVEAPRLLAVVSVFDPDPDTGYYGGTVSAPAVRAVLEEALLYLRVPTRDDPRRVAARPEEGGGG